LSWKRGCASSGPNSPKTTTKAINYCLGRWDAFTRFLDDGRLRMSNNGAERELRAVALGRKIRTSAGSDEGAGVRLRSAPHRHC